MDQKLPPFIRKIMSRTADAFGTTTEAIRGNRRFKNVSDARHVVAWIIRTQHKLSYPVIADHLGSKDHTTAMYGHDRISLEIDRGSLLGKRALSLSNELVADVIASELGEVDRLRKEIDYLRALAIRARDLLGVQCPPDGEDELEAIDEEMARLGLRKGLL